MQSFSTLTTNTSFSTDSGMEAEPVEPQETPSLLTRSSLLLTQALAAAHTAPDVRKDKVAAIKAQLAAGTYAIDSFRLAEALVNENPGLFREF